MSFEFKLPDIGEGLVEGEIVKWLVKEGDTVAEDQPLVEIMTDKATVEIPSPRSGIIAKLVAPEGSTVPVDATIVVIEEDGPPAAATPKAEPAKKAVTAASTSAAHVAPSPKPREPGRKVTASPAVRRYARDKGVDIQTLAGSGRNGRVERADVDRALAGASPALQPTAAAAGALTEEIPLRGLRKRIAEHMAESMRRAPQYTYVEEVDMSDVVRMRKGASEAGTRLSFIAFVVKALVPALKKFPLLNSTLDEERGVIVQKKYYNIGVAVETDDGLMVPVVKGADACSLVQVSAEIARLSADARERRIKVEDLRNSTFTITSVGNLGGVFGTPILNYPEVGILGVNRIVERPVVRDGQIVIRHMMHLSLSSDHRVIDGALAARFMNEIVANLQNPGFFLTT